MVHFFFFFRFVSSAIIYPKMEAKNFSESVVVKLGHTKIVYSSSITYFVRNLINLIIKILNDVTFREDINLKLNLSLK